VKAIPASVVCERVREQVSLQLDGELSQLERRMLESHLARCVACAEYAMDVRDFTERIRSEPLAAIDRPVVVRRHRTLTTARLQIGVAAAFALAALGLAGQLAAPQPDGSSVTRFDGAPSLSPPASVLEREQAILRVVRPGITLPSPGTVL